jgi:hypothetical protein
VVFGNYHLIQSAIDELSFVAFYIQALALGLNNCFEIFDRVHEEVYRRLD